MSDAIKVDGHVGKNGRFYAARSCSVAGCALPHHCRSYCRVHYGRWRSNGDPMVVRRPGSPPGVNHPNWRGGRWTGKKDGYVRVYVHERQRTVLEHVLVMEQSLGRRLYPGENVHHRNGIRTDNRLENLELWVVQQPAGQRVADLVEWAEEVLRRYGRSNTR